jgi:hypothetical protein
MKPFDEMQTRVYIDHAIFFVFILNVGLDIFESFN